MPQTPKGTNVVEATALSMYYADTPLAGITEATGLSENEISRLVEAQEREFAMGTAPTPANGNVRGEAVEQLLTWAEAHPAAGIRNKAVRIRSGLAELTDRRAADDAQREAEERVATAKAELARARQQLSAVKGTRPATTTATGAPTPIRARLGSGRTREELAAIRAWGREAGYQVADSGMVPKRVLAAYDAAHAPARKAS